MTLDGSDSFDPDGSIVSYQWEVVTDAYDWLEVTQANPRSPTATVELPSEKLIERLGYSIVFRLIVTDSGRPAATDSDTVALRLNQSPVISLNVTAKLLDRNDKAGVDDNRNGVVDENEERYTLEGVVRRPGQGGNTVNEWHVRAGTWMVLDGSESFDPDGELSDASFSWERLRTIGASSVARSLPNDTDGQMFLSTDEDHNTPASTSSETVARLPFVRGVGTEPFLVYYRLTLTDEDGATVREIAKIVFEDFHDHPEVEIAHPESNPSGNSSDIRQEGVLAAGEDRYVISLRAAENGVTLTAIGEGDGSSRTQLLRHTWRGAGVERRRPNEQGARTQAVFTAPVGTVEGTSFTVEVEVEDPDGLQATAEIELVVANTTPPTATAPDDIETLDSDNGGFPVTDPPSGIVILRGVGFDPDGDPITFHWEQVLNASGAELPVNYRGTLLSLAWSRSETASFRPPDLTQGTESTVYVQFTVANKWGVEDSDVVKIVIRDGGDDLFAQAGDDQLVASGSFVRLRGDFNSGVGASGVVNELTHQWVYKGIETDPPLQLRYPITRQEAAQGFAPGGWFPKDGGSYDPTAGGRLKNADTPFAYFDAPEIHAFDGVKLFFELVIHHRDDEHTDTVAITVVSKSGLKFYSGPIDGTAFCIEQSMGGPLTRPFDSDGDGVADVCALQETRRASIARQQALEQMAVLNPDEFNLALFGVPDDRNTKDVDESTGGTCRMASTDLGDTEEELAEDACARAAAKPQDKHTAEVSPPAVDPALARVFYSGVIYSPTFCANYSLGGPISYPFDKDGDDVADVCAQPYTRREAVARHNALRAAFAHHPQFPAALAAACTSLGTLDFGDPFAALAVDACNPTPTDFGNPLPSS